MDAASSAKKVADPLTSVLADLVRRNRASDALAVLFSVPDPGRRAEHLANALACAVRWRRPAAVADLLLPLEAEAFPAAAMESLSGLVDDTGGLYAVLTRLTGRRLLAVFRGCVVSGQEALALRLLPHLPPCAGTAQVVETPPLTLAAGCGRLRLLAALLDRQAATEAEDADGRTALDVACAAGQAGSVRLLLERGADPGRAGREGRTCRQRLADSGGVGDGDVGEIAALLTASECLGSSQSEREQSRQLHRFLCRCGFTARRAELHCEAADFLLHRVAQPMARRICRLGGSFAEGWGVCLVQANGRVAADSDVNWILDGMVDTNQPTPSRVAHAGTLVSADWATGSRPANSHEAARIAQLLRGCTSCQEVGRTSDLPACFADQERRVMRCLRTVQGQLFVIIKVIFKRLLPSIGAAGLTSYHAKTILFFMLARHSRRHSWWQPESLLPLARKALDLTLELMELDDRPCVCMPHFFAEDCHLAFRNPAEDTKVRVREALGGLRSEPARIDGFLRGLLRPMRPTRPPGLPLYFHPYALLPVEIGAEQSRAELGPGGEFADAYRLVLLCLTDLAVLQADAPGDKAACLARLSALPIWCQCARQCLTVMTHLRCGDRHRAAELLTSHATHRVQRFWDMERCFFFGGLPVAGSNGSTDVDVANCGDWGWRFCFSSKIREVFQQLPQFTQNLLQPRSDSPNRLYVNFRCIAWSLTAELLPKHMVQPAEWYAEMKYDPDYQELITLAHYSDSPSHLHFCSVALDDLCARSRLNLRSEIETVQVKLNSLTSGFERLER